MNGWSFSTGRNLLKEITPAAQEEGLFIAEFKFSPKKWVDHYGRIYALPGTF